MSKKEYCYYELNDNATINAKCKINRMLQAKLRLPEGPLIIDTPLIECIISMLDPVFYNDGDIKNYSKTYEEITKELIKEKYNQCSDEKFRKNWAINRMNGVLESFFNNKISYRVITGELKTAILLGVTKKDFKKAMDNLSLHRPSKRYSYILKTLCLENMKARKRSSFFFWKHENINNNCK
jgi:hypothetical protein